MSNKSGPLNRGDCIGIGSSTESAIINGMSERSEYTEQEQRLAELLTALGDVLPYLTPEDLDLWIEMEKRLALWPSVYASLPRKTVELREMCDTLVRILARHE